MKTSRGETSIGITWVIGSVATVALAFAGFVVSTTSNIAKDIIDVRSVNAQQNVEIATQETIQNELIRRIEHIDKQLDNIEATVHGQWRPITPKYELSSTTP